MPRWIFILPMLMLLGCEMPLQHPRSPAAFNQSSYYLVPDVKMPASLANENCGAQAIATAAVSLDCSPPPFSTDQLRAWKVSGANAVDLLIYARMLGLTAKVQRATWPSLLQIAQSNRRALVMFDSSIEIWSPFGWWHRPTAQCVYHWAVVSGFARDGSSLLLAAPDGNNYLLSHDSFTRRWNLADDCLITIALPGVATLDNGSPMHIRN